MAEKKKITVEASDRDDSYLRTDPFSWLREERYNRDNTINLGDFDNGYVYHILFRADVREFYINRIVG